MRISVVICTYNGERFIEEQLNSILRQTRSVDEIILMDDGSSDSTVDLAERILGSQKIPYQIIANSSNLGVSANFEKGIAKADGDIVLTADQDDVWKANKVQHFEKFFEKNSNCVLAFTDGYVTDSDLNVTRNSIWEAAGFTEKKKKLFQEKEYYRVLFSDNVITGAAMGVRRSFALKCIPAPKGTLHDYWYALNAPLFGDICFIEEKCILYRQHKNNVMGVPEKGLAGKIQRWIRSIAILENDRKIRAVRAETLEQSMKQMQEGTFPDKDSSRRADYMRQVQAWSKFCSWRGTLSEKNMFLAAGQIVVHAMKREYRRYADKTGVVFQDIFSCFFRYKGGSKG